MKWTHLPPCLISPHVFDFVPNVVKVARFSGVGDIRMFRLRGWKSFAELSDHDPRTGEPLRSSQWFVFVAK